MHPRPLARWPRRPFPFPLALAFLVLFALTALPPSLGRLLPVGPATVSTSPDLDRLALSFEPNMGQTLPTNAYLAHANGGTLYFSSSGITLSLDAAGAAQASTVRMVFVGSYAATSITGGELLPGRANYFLGSDPSRWRTNVPTYAGVTYGHLYDGVTLRYRGDGGTLKGTYTVAADANPAQIRWRYTNAESISLNDDGSLSVTASAASLTEGAPVAWQDIAGNRVPVSVRYHVAEDSSLGFAIGAYNSAYPLHIDPTLSYSTYFGGTNSESINGVGLDGAGNIYIAGETASVDLPVANPIQPNLRGAYDLFITKLTPDGSALIYSTYLGGGAEETLGGLSVDAAGNAYLAGGTESLNFPTFNALQPNNAGYYDGVVAKLNPSGGLVYSTYLGGSTGVNGADEAKGIAADALGNAYVTGETGSSDFPVVNAFQPTTGGSYDVFLSKINPSGSAFVYSTYLGGDSFDSGMAVAVDEAGSAYLTGRTDSTDFPLANPLQPNPGGGQFDMDAFVTKLSPSGSALIYSTYLGGSDNEPLFNAGIAVDSSGSAYVTGSTESNDFPVANAYQPGLLGYQDAYLSKLAPDGSTFVYSTLFGGTSGETGYAVAADGAGNAYITGYTWSDDLPLVEPVQPAYQGGWSDAYVTAFPADGSGPFYSTYLGGTDEDRGRAIFADGAGNTYVGGYTASADFPVTANAYQSTKQGWSDGFLSKLSYSPQPTPTGTPPTATPRPPTRTDTPTVTNTPNPCGLNWNIVPSRDQAIFEDVTVVSANDVWMVGRVAGGGIPDISLILHWDGSQWSEVAHPNPGTFNNALHAVTAVAASDVWAVGSYGDDGTTTRFLALHWDGQAWTQFTTPIIPPGQGNASWHSLKAVSATSSDDVWAVGSVTVDNRYRDVALHWDGTEWNLADTPQLENEDAVLQGVAAIAPDDVWAVGFFGAEGYYHTYSALTMHWDGTAWTIIPSPNPGGPGIEDNLYDVAASSSNDVWSVGTYGDPEQTLAMQWNGTQWTVVQSANSGTGDNSFTALTIISPNDIWAVGVYIEDYFAGWPQNLTEHWNGTQWSIVPSPSRGEIYNELFGVDAATPDDVWAVGYAQTLSFDGVTLRYSDACLTPSPTATGTPPTATPRPPTNTRTPTNTSTNTPTATPTVCGLLYPVLDDFEAGNLGAFVSSVPTCVPGGCGWASSTERWHSGTRSVHAPDVAGVSDQLLTTANPIPMPASVLSATLTFWHSYSLDQGFDGGVLETSTDGGSTWLDASPNIVEGGYTGLLSSLFGNPIGGRNAWTGSSGSDFVRVTVNLAPFAGTSLLVRFREGTDNSVGHLGWWVDDVRVTIVTQCGGGGSTSTPAPPTNTPGEETPTPTATVSSPQACNISFTDVPEGSTFYGPIICLACSGYISGYPDGTFRPNNLLTRGQLAKIVANVSQMPHNATGQTFEDVPPGSTFYPYIEEMAAAGYIRGYNCGSPGEPCGPGNRPYFRPGAHATRGQLTKIVANSAHLVQGGAPQVDQMFADVLPDNSFYMYVQALGMRNFMRGYECGGAGEPCGPEHMPYFRPSNNATRGQAAKIVANTYYMDCSP